MQEYGSVLKKIPLFHGFSGDEFGAVLNFLSAKKKSFKKNEIIKMEGDAADFIGIVLDGAIRIFQDDWEGRRIITSSFGGGEMFAEAFACADVEKLPVSISAETDCAILFLDKKRILGGSAEFCTRLSMNLLKIVARRNLFLNGKLSILSRKTTAEKIMAYLQQQSKICGSKEFEIPFDRQSLADFLGVERSAMSAEINRLKKSGRIDTRKNWFRVE